MRSYVSHLRLRHGHPHGIVRPHVLVLLLSLVVVAASPRGATAGDLDRSLENLDVFGDFRLRGEYDHKPDRSNRFRPRVRLRLGTTYDVGSQVTVGVRFTTGDIGDPRSPYETFQSNGKTAISIDRAFVHWRPSAVEGLGLTGGRFGHRFMRPVSYGEVVLDGDVQPAGGLVTYSSPEGGGTFLGLGDYFLAEQSTAADPHVTVAQAAVTAGRDNGPRVTIAADVMWFFNTNTTPVDALGSSTGRGNLTVDRGGETFFQSEFRVVQGFLNVLGRVGVIPIALAAGYFVNGGAVNADDSGYYAGARVGRLSKSRDLRAFAQYQRVEQEALFAPWAQDDFARDLGSGYQGVLGGVELGITETLNARLWLLTDRLLPPANGAPFEDDWYTRVRIDLNANFR